MKSLITVLVFLASSSAFAALQKQKINYSSDTTKLEGYTAFDDAGAAQKPAVIIVHDWIGPSDFVRGKADQLAGMGYVGFAADIYGVGTRPGNQTEAAAAAGALRDGDRKVLVARIQAAYEQVKAMKNVDPKKIVVMGYCFGGTVALELARSGVPLAGTTSFHGGLSTPNAANAKNIKGPVLVLHGADDTFVKAPEVDAFKKEMKEGKVKMKFVAYPGAVHSFSIPSAGNDPKTGAAYNAEADKKAWAQFTEFLTKATI